MCAMALPSTADRSFDRCEALHALPQGVLLVGHFPKGVGTRGVGEELAERLRGLGCRVLLTSQRQSGAGRLRDMIATILRKRREYRVAAIEVFSGLAFAYAEAAGLALQALGRPYVLTLHGGNLPAFARRWPGRTRRLLRSAAAVTAPSSYLIDELQSFRNDVQLLPNAVDVAAYPFRSRKSPRPRLIWLRAFHRIYNPTLAPRVVARLVPDFPDIQLTMVGSDKRDGSLQATAGMVSALSLANHVSLPGGVPKADVPLWLQRGDIFLNTSDIDNTPVSVVEAMAAGLAIVSTSVGGIPYLLKADHDALLVPAGDADAMARAVKRLLTEPGLAERLSRNARASAEQCDWPHVLPHWRRLLGSVAESGSA